MSNGAQQATGGATYRMLCELGSRTQPTFAAIREPHELVIAQRFVRLRGFGDGSGAGANANADGATPLEAEAMALLLRDARCLAKNWHPNVARIRHVDLASNGLVIGYEMVEGATLLDLIEDCEPVRTSPRDPLLPLPVLVRILLDVLGGLQALHGLRDGMSAPVDAIHGELCPANIVVGKDGVARIVNVLRKRPVRVALGSEAVGYAATEALDGAGTYDPRSDIHAVGVMLWEGIAGRRLHDETDPARVLSRQREGELSPPPIHPSSPFARLADTAMRALSFDPALRFGSPAEMAAELRKIAGSRLSSGSAVAMLVSDFAGDRIRLRRSRLEDAVSGTRRCADANEGAPGRAADHANANAGDEGAESADDGAAALPQPQRPPVRRVPHKSTTLRASPRRVVPTLAVEIPVSLIAASRRPSSPDVRDELLDDDLLEAVDDDDELPGPRASTPDLDVDAIFAVEGAAPAERPEASPRSAQPSSARPLSPLTPHLALPVAERTPGPAPSPMAERLPEEGVGPEAERLIATALAAATAQMRAVAVERAAGFPSVPGLVPPMPAPGTPVDFVIPIDVTETLNEAAPRQRRHLAAVAVSGAMLLLVMGGFVALQSSSEGRRDKRAPTNAAPAPPAAEPSPLELNPTAIMTTPVTRAAETASAPPAASVPPVANLTATTASAAPTAVASASAPPAGRASVAPPPLPTAAKPKKSLYDPDGL